MTEKPSNKILAATELDSDTWAGEAKRIRGKKLLLTAVAVQGSRAEYTRSIQPARALTTDTLKLECMLRNAVDQARGLTPAEIELAWEFARPRMSLPLPATRR